MVVIATRAAAKKPITKGARSDLLNSHLPSVSVVTIPKLEKQTNPPNTIPRAEGAVFNAFPVMVKLICKRTELKIRPMMKDVSITQLPLSPATRSSVNYLLVLQKPNRQIITIKLVPSINFQFLNLSSKIPVAMITGREPRELMRRMLLVFLVMNSWESSSVAYISW
jgi:hypothetical protein